jgi:hypothetical protein
MEIVSYIQILSTLNLSDITWDFRTVAIFVISDFQTIFHASFVGMFITYLHAWLQWYINYRCQTESQRKYFHGCHVAILPWQKFRIHQCSIAVQYPTLSGARVAPNSQVRASAMLLLPISDHKNHEVWMTSNGTKTVSNLIEIRPAFSSEDKWTDTISPICVHLWSSCEERSHKAVMDSRHGVVLQRRQWKKSPISNTLRVGENYRAVLWRWRGKKFPAENREYRIIL